VDEKLAIFGGEPVREIPLHYGRQYIDEDDIRAVTDVLRSDYLTTGPKVTELETLLCEMTGVNYAVAVANGTAALHAATYAAGIGEGDEVITTPITFAASANCVLYCGGKPVFADIDPQTYNISPERIREIITEKTKAVIAVDFAGQPVQIKEIRELCSAHGLVFIEDASHSLGSTYEGKPVGGLADLTVFSFHPVKNATSGEGGAVLTNDPQLYEKLKLFRTHGITRDPAQMQKPSDGPWFYDMVSLGYNYRITDFQCALLISQLKKLDAFKKRRKEIVQQYDAAFSQIPEVVLQKEIPEADSMRHLYILQLDLEKLQATRKEIFEALAAENVVPNVHYIPVYRMSYYENLGYPKGLCPEAERLYERILSIPLHYGLSDKDVSDVIAAVYKVLSHYRRV
jgi:UDP-4-amino-4,6-dideoxy-N-acetyl-beta-L-altrosamine transaminase